MSDFFDKPIPWGAAASDNIIREFRELIHSKRIKFYDVDQFESIVDYFLNNQDYSYAKIAIDMAVDQHPFSVSLLLRKAELLFHYKKLHESLRLLNRLAQIETSNPDILITMGAVYSRMGESKNAIHSLKKALKLVDNAESDHIWEAIGYEYWELDEIENSIQAFQKSLLIQPQNQSLLERVFEIYLSEYSNRLGLAFFMRLADKAPYNEDIWYYIASFQFGEQEFVDAKFSIELSLAVNDSQDHAYELLGNCCFELKEYSEAIDNYKCYLNKTRVSAQILTKIGECYELLGNIKYARFYFEKAIKLNPKYPDAYLGIGIVCNLEGRYEESLKSIRKAIRLNPKHNEYWHFLALCHGKFQEFERAIFSFEKSLELDAKQKITWLDLIDFLRDNCELESGMHTIEKALEQFPRDEDLLIRKTAFLFELGNKNRALSTFETTLFKENTSFSKILNYYPGIREIKEVKDLLELYS